MITDRYILVDKTPVPEPDLRAWGEWFETADRTVEKTELFGGEIVVSTVFLGLDHGWGDGPPVLFETLVFPDTKRMDRYCTWDEAVAGHERIVALVLEEAE